VHALYRRWITITVNSNSSDLILRSGETHEVFLKPGKSSVTYHSVTAAWGDTSGCDIYIAYWLS